MLNLIQNIFTKNTIAPESKEPLKTPQLIASVERVPRHYYSELNHKIEDLHKVSFKAETEREEIFYFKAQKIYSAEILSQRMAEHGFTIIKEIHPIVRESNIREYLVEKVAKDA